MSQSNLSLHNLSQYAGTPNKAVFNKFCTIFNHEKDFMAHIASFEAYCHQKKNNNFVQYMPNQNIHIHVIHTIFKITNILDYYEIIKIS